MKTGHAIVVAGFFVGAAIMFAGASITQAINSNYGADGVAGGVIFAIFGGIGLLLHHNASQAEKKRQSQAGKQ